MLIPAAAPRVRQFYALGNTPSASLARTVPHGVDARILALGCGDVRNILCTAYAETGLPERKLDFTCCDVIEDIHIRNTIFFSFLVDGSLTTVEQIDRLWDIYYHLYLDGDAAATVALLHAQLEKLAAASKSLAAWRKSPYGRCLRFCDEHTFGDVKAGLAQYRQAVQRLRSASDPSAGNYADRFGRELARVREALSERVGPSAVVYTGFRSVSPVVEGMKDVHKCFDHYWKEGTTNASSPSSAKKVPNPLFAEPALSGRLALHYGTEPTLGYHLATACTTLTADSPLRVDLTDKSVPGALPLIKAARVEFRAMVRAFMALRDRIVIRVATADALAFCHTLQACAASPGTVWTGHWYRRQFDAKPIVLDATEYATAPLAFDVVDTSNLSDHLGTLNLAVAAVPLLAPSPYATLLTELLLKPSDDANALLCGDMGTVALLLGIAPAELYTNARVTSSLEEASQMAAAPGSQSRRYVSWKLAHYFSGAPASSTPQKVAISTEELTHVFMTLYRAMFGHEKDLDRLGELRPAAVEALVRKSKYPVFHRGSLAAFIRFVKDRVTGVDWGELCLALMRSIFVPSDADSSWDHRTNSELNGHLYMWGVDEMKWMMPTADEVSCTQFAPVTSFGPQVLLAVTFEVPRASLDKLYEDRRIPRGAAPLLSAAISPPLFDKKGNDSVFSDVHLCFGTVRGQGARNTAAYRIAIDEDPAGWAGRAPLLVSFLAPSRALTDTLRRSSDLPKYVELQLHGDAHTRANFQGGLDRPGVVYRADLASEQVYITKHLPGHTGYPVACPSLPAAPSPATGAVSGSAAADFEAAGLTVDIRPRDSGIDSLRGRIAMTSAHAQALLADKAVPAQVEATASPFVLNVVFGRDAKAPAKQPALVCSVRFPQPVDSATAKLRMARKSQWVEVVARPLALGTSAALDDFIWPTHPTVVQGRPVAVSAAHINLDVLPSLALTARARKALDGWLPALSGSMFSRREHALNEEAPDIPGAGAPGRQLYPRVGFKESLHTMLMFVSGLQGNQTGLFGLTHPDRGGVHILLAVSALRLDTTGGSGSVVMDAAALPLTHAAMANARLRAFLEHVVRSKLVCNVVVDDAELLLWKKLLPALAERCRTWTHDPATCAYVRKSNAASTKASAHVHAAAPSIAVSLEMEQPVLCGCGQGHLPDGFMHVPRWNTGAKPFSTRIALGLLFSEPAVEPLRDLAREMANVDLRATPAPTPTPAPAPVTPTCASCGATTARQPAGGALLRCTRCRTARYCSAACQRADWPQHKRVCRAAAAGAAAAPNGGAGGSGPSGPEGLQVPPEVFREMMKSYGMEHY